MAKKNVPHVTLNFKDGSTQDFSGDSAQAILQAYAQHKAGEILGGVQFTNADGNPQYVQFDCLCGFIRKPDTQEDVPDRPCKQIDCFQ